MTKTAMSPVSIPRWQWRTFGADLSWLLRRLSTPAWVESRPVVETHLVCRHSTHHAWLSGGLLTLQWRVEQSAEGFELWDTILRTEAPFRAASLERLFLAWGLTAPEAPGDGFGVEGLLAGPIAGTPSVRAVEVERRARRTTLDGLSCGLETVAMGPSRRADSFVLEHEDPSLMAQLLRDLGLDALANTNFLQGLKQALDLPQQDPERPTWARKSNASSW
jgi:hypothetical protein